MDKNFDWTFLDNKKMYMFCIPVTEVAAQAKKMSKTIFGAIFL